MPPVAPLGCAVDRLLLGRRAATLRPTWLALLAVSLFVTGCDGTAPTGATSGSPQPSAAVTQVANLQVVFPQQAKADREQEGMEALLVGQLVLTAGCLRVNAPDPGISYLVIWPADYTLSTASGTGQILDERGQVIAQIGDMLRVTGGEVSANARLSAQLREPLPDGCAGPYWLASAVTR